MALGDEEHKAECREEDDRDHVQPDWQLDCVVHSGIVPHKFRPRRPGELAAEAAGFPRATRRVMLRPALGCGVCRHASGGQGLRPYDPGGPPAAGAPPLDPGPLWDGRIPVGHRTPEATRPRLPGPGHSSGGALHLDQAGAARPSEACATGCHTGTRTTRRFEGQDLNEPQDHAAQPGHSPRRKELESDDKERERYTLLKTGIRAIAGGQRNPPLGSRCTTTSDLM